MKRLTTFTALALAALSLTGCATTRLKQAWDAPGPPLKATAPLKGRAFQLHTVRVAPDVTPKGDIEQHCLPDSMYAAMLRYNLTHAFRSAGLTQGAKPAVPVDVTITERSFRTNLGGLRSSDFVANIAFAGQRVPVGFSGTGARGGINEVPDWRLEQRIVPVLAAKITNKLKSVQQGRKFPADGFGTRSVIPYIDGVAFSSGRPSDGLKHPMPATEIEKITGKTAKELHAICQADIAGH